MDIHEASRLYKQNSLLLLSPNKLLLKLLEEAIKALREAKKAMIENDISEKNKQIQVSQQLILELIPLINTSIDNGEQIIIVIDYVNRKLIEINMKNDITMLNGIESFLLDFRAAWNENKV
ncbi:flagellar export chaperone FliS [Metabacillus fastidiosus]|uniref:flagellar export chaperone FliS n=1 Tax=Metabacillus fastidiosus TaxID=1458 RepID=UPI002E24BAE0|nr:flagellar export chaperone FliS [Metabacillus fastidiosus]MED4454430.1 flagellar export chaperone FliS [Metabacillus fastidiosus]